MTLAIRVLVLLYCGMICCFAGYTLRKILITLIGVLGGAALGYVLAHLCELPLYWYGIAMMAGFGLALGFAAFRLHKLGLFLLCGVCAFWFVYRQLSGGAAGWLEGWMIWAVSGIAAVAVGLLVFKFYRPMVILSTAFFGATLVMHTVFGLMADHSAAVLWLEQGAALCTGILGALHQFRGPR